MQIRTNRQWRNHVLKVEGVQFLGLGYYYPSTEKNRPVYTVWSNRLHNHTLFMKTLCKKLGSVQIVGRSGPPEPPVVAHMPIEMTTWKALLPKWSVVYRIGRWTLLRIHHWSLLTVSTICNKYRLVVKRRAADKLLVGYLWLFIRFDRSRSFKVIDFRTNRNPIYDFLLVISCNLSSISQWIHTSVIRHQDSNTTKSSKIIIITIIN